jgi:hypothetical protein
VNSNEKTSSVAPVVGGFALGAMCGLLVVALKGRGGLASSRRRRSKVDDLYERVKHLLPPEDGSSAAHGPMTPQELAEEFDLTANL